MMNILKLFKLDHKYYLLILMPLLLVVSSCDNNNSAATLTGVTISPSAVPDGLPIDVTQQFTATGSYSDNSKQDLTKSVAWSSSTTAIATIDANGVATGVATGSTSITATLGGVTSNTVSLNVINPTLLSLVVTPATVPNLVVNHTQSFKAEGVFDNNKSYDVTQWVDWKSSDITKATIAQTGVATAVGIGITDITAATTTPAVTSNTVELEVILSNPAGVIIEPQTFDTLPINRKQQFKAIMKFDDGSLVDVSNNSTWSSSNAAIAKVSTNPNDGPLGQVIGVATGDATITATDNSTSLTKTVNVTVNDATITAVNIAPPSITLPAGYSQEFSATGTFTDGKTRQLSEPTAWAIDDTTIATIEQPDAKVDVRALKPGEAKVSYTDLLADTRPSGKSASSQLTVTDAILEKIDIHPSAPFSIPSGGQTSLTAMGLYSDTVSRDITSGVIWESSAPSIVVVDSDGKLTALSAGVSSVLAKAQNTATPPAVISSAAVNVTVLAATLQSLTIQPQLDSEVVGLTRQFSVTGTYDSGTSSFTQRATWTSSDPAIFTVSNDIDTKGQVTGVAAGIATLTAKDPETGISDTLSVTVSQP